jgi:hypothetical protein
LPENIELNRRTDETCWLAVVWSEPSHINELNLEITDIKKEEAGVQPLPEYLTEIDYGGVS